MRIEKNGSAELQQETITYEMYGTANRYVRE